MPEKIFNCHNSNLGLLRYAQNLMIYVNSETILNTDSFLSLYRGELSTGTDKIIYQLPMIYFRDRSIKEIFSKNEKGAAVTTPFYSLNIK